MSVEVVSGDLFESGAQALVNAVNTEGVMGKGVALEFKKRYPKMYEEYVIQCKKGTIKTGRVWLWDNEGWKWERSFQANPQYIINFPTKDDWRLPSRIEWIEQGLDDLRFCVILFDIQSIALPALGCGQGDLSFEDVSRLVKEKLNGVIVQKTGTDEIMDIETSVFLFQPR